MGLAVISRIRGDWPFLAVMLVCGVIIVACVAVLGHRVYEGTRHPVPVPSVFTPSPGSP